MSHESLQMSKLDRQPIIQPDEVFVTRFCRERGGVAEPLFKHAYRLCAILFQVTDAFPVSF